MVYMLEMIQHAYRYFKHTYKQELHELQKRDAEQQEQRRKQGYTGYSSDSSCDGGGSSD